MFASPCVQSKPTTERTYQTMTRLTLVTVHGRPEPQHKWSPSLASSTKAMGFNSSILHPSRSPAEAKMRLSATRCMQARPRVASFLSLTRRSVPDCQKTRGECPPCEPSTATRRHLNEAHSATLVLSLSRTNHASFPAKRSELVQSLT